MKNRHYMLEGVPTLEVNDPAGLGEHQLIDVREPHEFDGELGHIANALLVPLGGLTEFLKREDKHSKILFICRSGARSGRATLQAMAAGFTDVSNMAGGMLEWNSRGFPVER